MKKIEIWCPNCHRKMVVSDGVMSTFGMSLQSCPQCGVVMSRSQFLTRNPFMQKDSGKKNPAGKGHVKPENAKTFAYDQKGGTSTEQSPDLVPPTFDRLFEEDPSKGKIGFRVNKQKEDKSSADAPV